MTKKTTAVVLAAFAAFLLLISGFFLGRKTVRSVRVTAERSALVTAEETVSEKLSPDERVNINTATVEELMQLPQIGETIAQRIIAYRELHGDFAGISELMNVEGIGEGRYEAIKDYVTVR